jgi:hypothetical protein
MEAHHKTEAHSSVHLWEMDQALHWLPEKKSAAQDEKGTQKKLGG